MIHVLMYTKGNRDHFARSIASFRKNLKTYTRMEWTVIDHSGSAEFREWVATNFPWVQVSVAPSIQESWSLVSEDYILQFWDHHLLEEEMYPHAAMTLIEMNPHLVQLSLDVLEDGIELKDNANQIWVEHDNGWSMNPSIFRTAITDLGWPARRNPEEKFTQKIKKNSDSWRFASLKSSDPIVSTLE